MSVRRQANVIEYKSARRHGPAGSTHIIVEPGAAVETHSDLEAFLSARWRLYAYRRRRLLRADVEHPRWPLQRARVHTLDETLLTAAGLPAPPGAPLAHFSPGTRVLTGWLNPV